MLKAVRTFHKRSYNRVRNQVCCRAVLLDDIDIGVNIILGLHNLATISFEVVGHSIEGAATALTVDTTSPSSLMPLVRRA